MLCGLENVFGEVGASLEKREVRLRRGMGLAGASLGGVVGDVDGDAEEPGGEGGFAAESVEAGESAEEGVLDAVLGVVGGAGDAEGEVVDLRSVEDDEAVEGFAVALLGASDEDAYLGCVRLI